MQDTLARKLRVLRAERQLTVRQAAALTGVDPGTISKLERGIRHPHDITLSRLAAGYGVPIEELLAEEPQEPLAAPKAEAPSRSGRNYPYPWMGDALARTLDRWRRDAGERQDPHRSHIIAVGCFDVLESVLRFDVPGNTLADRVPEEEFEERAELADWLFDLAQRAQNHYADSKEGEATEVSDLEKRREEIRRRTREIAS